MIKRVIFLVFCVLTSLVLSANATDDTNELYLVGIDNVAFPDDSLILMNSLLIDFQVDYDIAFANSNPKGIVTSLHKIGLVYYHLEEFDLAINYAWRLLNVAKKHNFTSQESAGYALLYKINVLKGETKKAESFYAKYKNTVDPDLVLGINEDLNNDLYAFQTDTTSEVKPVEIQKPVQLPIVLKDKELKSGIVNMNFFLVSLFLVALIVALLIWKRTVLFQRNIVIQSNSSQSHSFVRNDVTRPVPKDKSDSSQIKKGRDVEDPDEETLAKDIKETKVVHDKVDEILERAENEIVRIPEPVQKPLESKPVEVKVAGSNDFFSLKDKTWTLSIKESDSLSHNDVELISKFTQSLKSLLQASSNIKGAAIQVSVTNSGVVVMANMFSYRTEEDILNQQQVLSLKKQFVLTSEFILNTQRQEGGLQKITLKKTFRTIV